jgi:hypothetical protein
VFVGAAFQDRASFDEITVQGPAQFDKAAFKGETVFQRATFEDEARFDGATFETAREFGPVLARHQLVFDTATFKLRARIEAAAATVCARRAQFPTGVQLWLRWAEVVLDEADLAAPSILTGAGGPFTGLDERRFAAVWARRPPERRNRARPRLLSVRRADVAGLAVSNVDLRPCRFVGAHNLDKLRIEGELELAAPPGGWRRGWRWTRRRVLADEHHWRYDQQKRRRAALERSPLGAISRSLHRLLLLRQPERRNTDIEPRWYKPTTRSPGWLDDVKLLEAVEIAALYRTLRKGREDGKDEPGAADFYYGEMEMRRHGRRKLVSRSWQRGHPGGMFAAATEYVILWWYWLISGYGLRAWRALAALAVMFLAFAVLFTAGGGFAPSAAKTSFGGALVYEARTVIGLAHNPQPALTRFGDVLQILLRVFGPVLLGLAVLSVRGRVKR